MDGRGGAPLSATDWPRGWRRDPCRRPRRAGGRARGRGSVGGARRRRAGSAGRRDRAVGGAAERRTPRGPGADRAGTASPRRRRCACSAGRRLDHRRSVSGGCMRGGRAGGGGPGRAGPARALAGDLARGAPHAARALADALSGGHAVRGALARGGRAASPARPGRELAARGRALGARRRDRGPCSRRCAAARADPAWDTIVAAILLQREAGGDLAGLLRTSRRARGAARLEADARSATAQARFTAWLVALLPVGAAALAELARPGYVGELLPPRWGRGCWARRPLPARRGLVDPADARGGRRAGDARACPCRRGGRPGGRRHRRARRACTSQRRRADRVPPRALAPLLARARPPARRDGRAGATLRRGWTPPAAAMAAVRRDGGQVGAAAVVAAVAALPLAASLPAALGARRCSSHRRRPRFLAPDAWLRRRTRRAHGARSRRARRRARPAARRGRRRAAAGARARRGRAQAPRACSPPSCGARRLHVALGVPRARRSTRCGRRCPVDGVARSSPRSGAPTPRRAARPRAARPRADARAQRAQRLRERAARAAPKIQLVVALLLVPGGDAAGRRRPGRGAALTATGHARTARASTPSPRPRLPRRPRRASRYGLALSNLEPRGTLDDVPRPAGKPRRTRTPSAARLRAGPPRR